MSTYEDYENANPSSGTYTYFEPNNTPADPNTITDLSIESIEAATSSLQLGTDPLETQVIEIGSAEVTTTIYGAVNFLHPINVLRVTITNGLNVGGKTTLANVSATELTSTNIDASILKTTTLNATGTTTLGLLYAGNCSLLNVSAARVELNTLTGVNCSVSNVSASRLEANTLTARDVSTANLNVGNVLTSAPIPTGYTNVVDPVGTSLPLTFTPVTLNGVAAQIGQDDFYTYTSTYVPEYNMITGKLNLTPVFAQTTYRVCFSVNALNNPVDLFFQDDANTLFTLGTIETTPTPRKKYVFYLKPTVTGRLYLTISRAAEVGAVEIQYDFLSVDAWYETNLSTVNATGSALLASSGGQVGVGTTNPGYTLDVSGTMRVTGETIINTPITPIYAYPVIVAGQIGYVYPNVVGTGTITVEDRIHKMLLSQAVPSGVFLVSAYYRAYTTTTPTFSAINVGPSVGVQTDGCSVITNSSVTPTSCVTCFLNYSAPGIIYSSAFVGAAGSIIGSTCILKVMRVA